MSGGSGSLVGACGVSPSSSGVSSGVVAPGGATPSSPVEPPGPAGRVMIGFSPAVATPTAGPAVPSASAATIVLAVARAASG